MLSNELHLKKPLRFTVSFIVLYICSESSCKKGFPSRKLFTRYSRKLFTRQAVSYSLGRPKTGQFILNMLFIVGRFLVSLYSMYARTLYYIHENER